MTQQIEKLSWTGNREMKEKEEKTKKRETAKKPEGYKEGSKNGRRKEKTPVIWYRRMVLRRKEKGNRKLHASQPVTKLPINIKKRQRGRGPSFHRHQRIHVLA